MRMREPGGWGWCPVMAQLKIVQEESSHGCWYRFKFVNRICEEWRLGGWNTPGPLRDGDYYITHSVPYMIKFCRYNIGYSTISSIILNIAYSPSHKMVCNSYSAIYWISSMMKTKKLMHYFIPEQYSLLFGYNDKYQHVWHIYGVTCDNDPRMRDML